MSLPTDDKTRKGLLLFQGLLKYFPHALAAVAESSRIANEQHNPGEPVHWAKEKSRDELDSLLRHVTDMAVDKEHRDPDGIMAAVKCAWRALANLERMHDDGTNIFHEEQVDLQEAKREELSSFSLGFQRGLQAAGEDPAHGVLTGGVIAVQNLEAYVIGLDEALPDEPEVALDDVAPADWDNLT